MNTALETPWDALYRQHLDQRLAELDRILADAQLDGVLIHSGVPRHRFCDDATYPFYSNPHFTALVPLEQHAHGWIIYRPGQRPLLAYYQPHDYWHPVAADPEGYWVDQFELKLLRSPDEVSAYLPEDLESYGYIGEAPGALAERIGSCNGDELMAPLNYQRGFKTEYELACLRAANRRAVAGYRAAEQAFHQGATGLEIHLAYLGAVGHAESALPYSNIIALNERAAVLHYTHYDTERMSNRSLLVDAGAQVAGYGSDISRTFVRADRTAAGSAAESGFQALRDRIDQLQQALVAAIRPGLEYAVLNEQYHHQLARLLQEAELVHASEAEIFAENWTGVFMPHGLGHLLGVQVHDVGGWQIDRVGQQRPRHPRYPALRTQRPLAAGLCVTIEPGLYFIPQLLEPLRESAASRYFNWALIDELYPFGGIRIEDDVVLDAQGAVENLTRDAFAAQA